MKKYELKRASIRLLEESRLKNEKEIYRGIDVYKKEIAKLPQPINRKSRQFLEFQREIHNFRRKLKNLRHQELLFEVFVKQYNKFTLVNYTFQHRQFGPEYREEYKAMLKQVVNQAITKIRQEQKVEPKNQSWFGKFGTQFLGDKKTLGRTFYKEGEVLRIYVEKNLNSLYTDKKPVEPRKYIGIELEFCAPIKENLFAIKLFRSGVHKFAQLKKDQSLRPHPGEYGYELAILLEESNYKKRLKQLTQLLSEVKAVATDRRAGLHVHLDMRRRDKELVYNNLVACQYALLAVVDPRRIDNEFCRIVASRKFPTEFTGEREERYKTINAAAFYKYKTLEVRMHEGSVDYTQISNWVDLLIRVAGYNKKIKDNVTKVSILKKRMSLDSKLYNYIQDRSCYWQLNNNGEQGLAGHLDRLNHVERLRDQLRTAQFAMEPQTMPIVPIQAANEVGMLEYQVNITNNVIQNPFLTIPGTLMPTPRWAPNETDNEDFGLTEEE